MWILNGLKKYINKIDSNVPKNQIEEENDYLKSQLSNIKLINDDNITLLKLNQVIIEHWDDNIYIVYRLTAKNVKFENNNGVINSILKYEKKRIKKFHKSNNLTLIIDKEKE
jgi:lipopolysaccharide export LptBFGC system permease protein LptF